MAGQNMDQFEAFFKRADLDHDGRISGAEAVYFFQGSGLSKQVLAQIWVHADQSRAGFLGRQEFYNALKLVTVAQSKRELTPEMVKAALYGPASSKIPPPQINLPSSPIPQYPPVSSSPTMQMNASTGPGYRGPVPPNQNMNQLYYPSPGNQLIRPSQGVSASSVSQQMHSLPGLSNTSISPNGLPNPGTSIPGRPSTGMSTPAHPGPVLATHGVPNSGMSTTGLQNSSISTDWLGGRANGAPSGPTSVVPSGGTAQFTSQDIRVSSQTSNIDSKGNAVPGAGLSSISNGGGDPFAAFQFTKSGSSTITSSITPLPTSSTIDPVSAPSPPPPPPPSSSSSPSPSPSPTTSTQTSSAIVPVSSAATQPSSVPRSLESLQSAYAKQPVGGQLQHAHSPSNSIQSVTQVISSGALPGTLAGAGNVTSHQSQPPWPKMTNPGVQKYTKVFMEVDTDRDGKITGEEARKLFLSWRLPKEVLKQVWDLADQDSDSMLSLREFCIALYLMERYREGRTLPVTLPNSIMFDESLMRMTGLPHSSHGNTAWGAAPTAGFRPAQGMPTASYPVGPVSGLRPVVQPPSDLQQKARTPGSVDSQVNQLNDTEQNFHQPSLSETNEAEKKAVKVEKVILDSREKLDYYRTKMQELVLYKSRCDNRLNEIIERASADKREAELLGKKYEEKYKQVAEIASKLTIEEAKFREYQERKTELQQAITNMEQGGSADGILQVRADRIQSDFEELLKALSERCTKHGIEIKSAALIELPRGWQPGIQEGAAVWDEEWDKFEDDGLLFDKEVMVDTQNARDSPNSILHENGTFLHDDLFDPDSPSNGDVKLERHSSLGEHALDSESRYTHSENDSARSPRGSPSHRSALESPSQDFSDIFARSSEADGDFNRSFDDQGWGTFDGNDDVDSVWGFNSKEQHGGFGIDSPHRDNTYGKRSPFTDCVPGTSSFSKSGNSPRFNESGDDFFDNSSRFDSFSMNESSRFSPPRETLTRFDSISSSRSGFGHSRGFTSFDDADPFGSSGPFKVSSETPRKGSDNWSSF